MVLPVLELIEVHVLHDVEVVAVFVKNDLSLEPLDYFGREVLMQVQLDPEAALLVVLVDDLNPPLASLLEVIGHN